jgi:hypothetical protein
MALTRGRLANVTQVSAGSTSAIITVADNKKVYVKSIAIHDAALAGVACTAHVYVVPNGGSVGDATRMFNVALTAKETVLIEPAYPIVLQDTGDTLQVGGEGGTINVLVNGDKEV